VSPRQT